MFVTVNKLVKVLRISSELYLGFAEEGFKQTVFSFQMCEAKRWSHWTCSSLGTIFQPMRINSVPDVKCFCNNTNVLCAQSMVWHFVRHPVDIHCTVFEKGTVVHVCLHEKYPWFLSDFTQNWDVSNKFLYSSSVSWHENPFSTLRLSKVG